MGKDTPGLPDQGRNTGRDGEQIFNNMKYAIWIDGGIKIKDLYHIYHDKNSHIHNHDLRDHIARSHGILKVF